MLFFSPYAACSPIAGYGLLILEVLRDHTQRHTTVGRTPLDEWSARRRDLYLTTHNTHNRQTSMPPAGFEPTISAGERPQTTYALDRAAAGTGIWEVSLRKYGMNEPGAPILDVVWCQGYHQQLLAIYRWEPNYRELRVEFEPECHKFTWIEFMYFG